MENPTLYPAQLIGVKRYLSLAQPRRFIFPWKTGCGKTAAALSVVKGKMNVPTYLPPRTLIVCPAIVRNHWYREIAKWIGGRAQQHAAEITIGRTRKLTSAKARERRDRAYAAPIQIVSYDLIGHVDPTGWNQLILDELHHLAQPRSKQSKLVRALVAANPSADILGLSATLIPTEARQLWNPLRTMFGAKQWGEASRTGDISWDFAYRYCNIITNEYGCQPHGLKKEAIGELRSRLAGITYPLSRDDIIADLPPLDLKVLQFADVRGPQALAAQLVEWAQAFDSQDVTHKVILVRHRELAKSVVYQLQEAGVESPITYIDGTVPPAARIKLLDGVACTTDQIVVGTHEAISEGIRLMWAQQVIIAEWSQSPGRISQLIGRFNSVGSSYRPQVTIHSTNQTWAAANTLIRRMGDVASTLGASASEQEMRQVFAKVAEVGTIEADDWAAVFDSEIPNDWSEDHALES